MSEDTDKLELLAKSMKGLVSVGEKVMKDNKIDLADLQHAPELAEHLSGLVKAVSFHKEMLKEVKDIDAAEAVKLVQLMLGA
ncbi:MAG: hypothetical protein KDH96_10270 [Candidatus Riesia sp.]|nr:hypothetical protein [Candidatus Riesia sp.]